MRELEMGEVIAVVLAAVSALSIFYALIFFGVI